MSLRVGVIAGTDVEVLELDKPLKCSECGRETYVVDLGYLNFETRAVCDLCSADEWRTLN